MKKQMTIHKKKSGYAVLELLFYISVFVVLSVAVIDAMITMTRSFRETALQAEFAQTGAIMERVSREIRQAYDISSISAGDLGLNTKDSSGANKTVEFLLSGTNLELLENGTLTGNLNTPTIAVTALAFTQITTTKGKAVKISMTLKSTNDTQAHTEDFYDTIVLRGLYQ